MTTLTSKETNAAAAALLQWFKSQDLEPAHAISVFARLLAMEALNRFGPDAEKRLQETGSLLTSLMIVELRSIKEEGQ